MISKQMVAWGESGSSIREIAAYGERRAAEIGPENVYNFAIGNPEHRPAGLRAGGGRAACCTPCRPRSCTPTRPRRAWRPCAKRSRLT
ncbi:MAG: hypothetical protein ACLSHG_13760 [Oscillospiraceae bacterium]